LLIDENLSSYRFSEWEIVETGRFSAGVWVVIVGTDLAMM
jgi:hypothetical protein